MTKIKSFDELDTLIPLLPAAHIRKLMSDGVSRTIGNLVMDLIDTPIGDEPDPKLYLSKIKNTINFLIENGDIQEIKREGMLAIYVRTENTPIEVISTPPPSLLPNSTATTLKPPEETNGSSGDQDVPKKTKLHPNDSKSILIWKLMSDFQPWTLKKLSKALNGFNFGDSTISVNLSYLNKLGWFHKNKTEYVLNSSIECPDKLFTPYPKAKVGNNPVPAAETAKISLPVKPAMAADFDGDIMSINAGDKLQSSDSDGCLAAPVTVTSTSDFGKVPYQSHGVLTLSDITKETVLTTRHFPNEGVLTLSDNITAVDDPSIKRELHPTETISNATYIAPATNAFSFISKDNTVYMSGTFPKPALISVYLKGIEFPVNELNDLLNEIMEITERELSSTKTIQVQTTFTIKGISFTFDELNEILIQAKWGKVKS